QREEGLAVARGPRLREASDEVLDVDIGHARVDTRRHAGPLAAFGLNVLPERGPPARLMRLSRPGGPPSSKSYFASGQPLSFKGRKASSPGTVATRFTRSHSPFDSSGVLACIRYMSRTTWPSTRTLPFLVMKSLTGISRILASTALASSVPAAFTALR